VTLRKATPDDLARIAAVSASRASTGTDPALAEPLISPANAGNYSGRARSPDAPPNPPRALSESADPRDADLAIAPVATAAMIEADGFRRGVEAAARAVTPGDPEKPGTFYPYLGEPSWALLRRVGERIRSLSPGPDPREAVVEAARALVASDPSNEEYGVLRVDEDLFRALARALSSPGASGGDKEVDRG
jgi:hypothetical protein